MEVINVKWEREVMKIKSGKDGDESGHETETGSGSVRSRN